MHKCFQITRLWLCFLRKSTKYAIAKYCRHLICHTQHSFPRFLDQLNKKSLSTVVCLAVQRHNSIHSNDNNGQCTLGTLLFIVSGSWWKAFKNHLCYCPHSPFESPCLYSLNSEVIVGYTYRCHQKEVYLVTTWHLLYPARFSFWILNCKLLLGEQLRASFYLPLSRRTRFQLSEVTGQQLTHEEQPKSFNNYEADEQMKIYSFL